MRETRNWPGQNLVNKFYKSQSQNFLEPMGKQIDNNLTFTRLDSEAQMVSEVHKKVLKVVFQNINQPSN